MSWYADGMSTVTELTWSPPAAGSKYGDQRHWRPGYRQLTFWQVVPGDDWYWQSAVSAGQVGRRRVPAVPGIAAQFHVLLCKSSRRPCNRSADGRAANEEWQARQWCGPRISYDRSAVLQRSVHYNTHYCNSSNNRPTIRNDRNILTSKKIVYNSNQLKALKKTTKLQDSWWWQYLFST